MPAVGGMPVIDGSAAPGPGPGLATDWLRRAELAPKDEWEQGSAAAGWLGSFSGARNSTTTPRRRSSGAASAAPNILMRTAAHGCVPNVVEHSKKT
uniref:Uncharacterized protein n=1 Tax=Mantoniella antarctica TaxID=81844 RepID=A0A7S0SLF5_9CHLO